MRYEDYQGVVEALATLFDESPQNIWQVFKDNPPMTSVEVTHVSSPEEGQQLDLEDLIERMEGMSREELDETADRLRDMFLGLPANEQLEALFERMLEIAQGMDKVREVVNIHAKAGNEMFEDIDTLDETIKTLAGTMDAMWSRIDMTISLIEDNTKQLEELRGELRNLKQR
jgi:archaellum component FlaC